MHTNEAELFIFLWIVVYIYTRRYLRNDWMNGSYAVNEFVAFGTKR